MSRVENDLPWSLFCPTEVHGLTMLFGEEFEKKYVEYENVGLARKVISARSLWESILESQVETGGPFMMYKDAVNGLSMSLNVRSH